MVDYGMSSGDPRLPNRIAWLPALLCCNITVVVATVIIAVFFTKTLSDHISEWATVSPNQYMDTVDNEARHQLGDGDLYTSSRLDTILRKRKAINPQQPTEEVRSIVIPYQLPYPIDERNGGYRSGR